MKKSHKTLWIILAAIVLLLLVLFLGGSWFIGRQIVMASTNLTTNEETLAVIEEAWALEKFDEAAFREAYTIETKTISSSMEDGHGVPFDLIMAQDNEKMGDHGPRPDGQPVDQLSACPFFPGKWI